MSDTNGSSKLSLTSATANAQQSELVARVPIYQPNGEPYMGADGEEAWIGALGAESKRYRQAEHAISRRNQRNTKPRVDPVDVRRNRIDLAVACVAGWNAEDENGQQMECNAENAERLFAFEHILRQVEMGIHAHADFFAKSSPTP